MILLLGKNNLVEKYAKEILNADIDNYMVYYPDEKTHYSELPQWVEIARKEQPYIVTTQNIEMIDIFLYSDLDFKIITVYNVDGELLSRTLTKEKAVCLKEKMGLELRWKFSFFGKIGGKYGNKN